MDRERITSTAFAAIAGLALAAQPVAAQASSSDAAISGLNEKLLVVAIPITVLVEAVLIYTVFKYKDQDEAKPTRENRRLEITWTIATAAVLLFVGISASITMADDSVIIDPQNQAEMPEDAEQVNVTAYRYAWTFSYPDYNVSVDSGSNALLLAKGQPTYFSLTTQDWLHAFHVPTLGLKHDAVPGEVAWLKTTPYEVGTYQGYCAEYCGVGHSAMMFEVQVVEDEQALIEELQTICNERENKAWNNETNTCEWTGSGNSTDNSSSVSASDGPTASVSAPDTRANGAIAAARAY